jgi:hypothetical protein
MTGTVPADRVEPTIAAVVNRAAARVGLGCLARRAAVPRDVVATVRYTTDLSHGSALRRLLAEAERVLQEEPR